MIKFFCFNFLILLCTASVIQVPKLQEIAPKDLEEIQEKWIPHILDFLNLIDVDKVLKVVIKYSADPDVLNFVAFASSPQFKQILIEYQDLEEFKEAVNYLQSKGYDIKSILNLINSDLISPTFETQEATVKNGGGLSELIHEVVQALPLENMKKLFEEKLQTSPEVADLFEALSSEEFVDIMTRLAENPKSLEIKSVFESYGLDFNDLIGLFEDIFGDNSNKIFGKTNQI